MELARHTEENRRYWDDMAPDWSVAGERAWAQDVPAWGNWQLPDDACPLLPEDMAGLDAVELGCGTGYVSRWMEVRGARVLGIDNSAAQLSTARRLAAEHRSRIEWLHGSAEDVPRPDGSFDVATSEYGAAIWCDPEVWVPEAHRLLRPGGLLSFLGNHPLAMCCVPSDGAEVADRLQRSWFDLHELDWTGAALDPGGIEFNLPTAGWLDLFRRTGFEVVDHRELRAPDGPDEVRYGMPRSWARRWPAEQAWWLRKR